MDTWSASSALLEQIRTGTDHEAEDIQAVASQLMPQPDANPYWSRVARMLLVAYIGMACRSAQGALNEVYFQATRSIFSVLGDLRRSEGFLRELSRQLSDYGWKQLAAGQVLVVRALKNRLNRSEAQALWLGTQRPAGLLPSPT